VTIRAGERASVTVPIVHITAKSAEKVSIEVPLVEVTASGKVETLGRASFTVPLPGVAIRAAEKATLSVPLAMITASGLNGSVGRASFEVPCAETTAHGDTPTIGRASITVPTPRISGSDNRDIIAQASITVPLVKVSPTGLVGTLGQASITVPLVTIDTEGHLDVRGSASITVPLPSIMANVPETVVIVDISGDEETVTGYALVLNLENNALTEYDNYAFNSFAYFNGRYLGASETGIYNLTGRNDNDGTINAKARTGLQDGGSANRKGIEDAFVGLSTDGILTAKIVGDDKRTYQGKPIEPRNDELVTERVKFGKGIRSRYLGMEFENKNGCDFTIESAELVIVPLTRKM
jgi:hypothetical protein